MNISIGGIVGKTSLEMSAQLHDEVLPIVVRKDAGRGIESPEVVLGERVQSCGVHVVPSMRIVSTVSRNRPHSAVKSCRARRPFVVMA